MLRLGVHVTGWRYNHKMSDQPAAPIHTEFKITHKMEIFVEGYLQYWNGTKAAEKAGYKNPSLAAIRLLKHAEIQERISARMAVLSMKTDEVLTRLTQQAQLNASDFFVFVTLKNGQRKMDDINWAMVEQKGYLIKALKYDRQGRPMLEFLDAQKALELIGRSQGMFIDVLKADVNSEIKGYVGISPDDWDQNG